MKLSFCFTKTIVITIGSSYAHGSAPNLINTESKKRYHHASNGYRVLSWKTTFIGNPTMLKTVLL